MTLRLAVCLITAVLAPFSVAADELTLPANARQLALRVSELDSYALAVGPFDASVVPVLGFEGRVERLSWRLDATDKTTLQVLAPLRDQIIAAGYDVLFDCGDLACGGFDFRFAIEVIAAPDMHVNIRDYRYLGAKRGDDEALSLVVSRAGTVVYIQAIHVAPQGQDPLSSVSSGEPDTQVSPSQLAGLADTLTSQGHVVLPDLVFETGAARLGPGPFASLAQLANFLKANPDYRIALVGHTDNIGSLDSNISLSKRRAGSVRARMGETYDISQDRIDAEGMGYLAPVASNMTPDGREANRRVEAILLSR